MTSLAQTLAGEDPDNSLESSDRLLNDALDTLAEIQRHSRAALESLLENGHEVIHLLERSAVRVTVNQEVSRLVEAVSVELETNYRLPSTYQPATLNMLTCMERIYTMAVERTLHASVVGGSDVSEPVLVDDFML